MSAPNQPLAEALADLHAIVDGDDIDTGPPDEADDLRAQVAALTAERDQARAERDEAIQKATAGAVEALEHPAVVAVCKGAEEGAERLKAERDRLARVLACEVGDAGHAPDGWQRNIHHMWWKRTPDFYLKVFKWDNTYTWEVWDAPDMNLVCHGRKKYARDAMEAADEAARAGEVADKPDT